MSAADGQLEQPQRQTAVVGSLSPRAFLHGEADSCKAAKTSTGVTPAAGKRKKSRTKGACIPCQQRKSRCDQEDPCGACTKRGSGDKCEWEAPQMRGMVADEVAREFANFQRRFARLEKIVSGLSNVKESHSRARKSSEGSQVQSADNHPEGEDFSQQETDSCAMGQTHEQYRLDGSASSVSEPQHEAFTADMFDGLAPDAGMYEHHGLVTIVQSTPPSTTFPLASSTFPAHATSILVCKLDSENGVFNRASSLNHLQLLGDIPDEAVSSYLTQVFFDDAAWCWSVLHEPTHLNECTELFHHLASKNTTSNIHVDAAWLATYYAVLTWGMSALQLSSPNGSATNIANHSSGPLPPQLQSLTPQRQKEMCERWLNASEEALDASKWTRSPQVRALQAMCLNIAFRRPIFTSGAGVSFKIPTSWSVDSQRSLTPQGSSAFYISVSMAVRLAQLLGLHKLGSHPLIMPRDDPAWPQAPCGLRRELAKRIWAFVLGLDWYYCAPKGIAMVTEDSFDTSPPLNADDTDLGADVDLPKKPAGAMTETSLTLARLQVARWTLHHYDLARKYQGQIPYHIILEVTSAFQEMIKTMSTPSEFDNPRRNTFHRNYILTIYHNRIIQVHWLYFLQIRDPSHQQSQRLCLDSAVAIATMITCVRGTYMRGTSALSYATSAAIVLFVALVDNAEDSHYSKRDIEDRLRNLRNYIAETIFGETQNPISEQYLRLLDTFQVFSYQRLNLSGPDRLANVVSLFRQVKTFMQLGSSTSGGAPQQKGSDPQQPSQPADTRSSGFASGASMGDNSLSDSTLLGFDFDAFLKSDLDFFGQSSWSGISTNFGPSSEGPSEGNGQHSSSIAVNTLSGGLPSDGLPWATAHSGLMPGEYSLMSSLFTTG